MILIIYIDSRSYPRFHISVTNLNSQLRASIHNPVEVELLYVIGMLEYILERLRSKDVVSLALHRRKLGPIDDERGSISAGCFLNLRCGHNNQYSVDERERLMTLITRACGDQV